MSDTTIGTTRAAGSAAAPTKPPAVVHTTWAGDQQFDSGRPGGPTLRLDGRGATGQSPVDAVLSALAACSGIDLVDIMAKRRTPVERLEIDSVGVRRDDPPRRFLHLTLTYRVDGAGIEAVHVERALALAFEKYCSVSASLAPDLVVETVAVVNGATGAPVRQKIAG